MGIHLSIVSSPHYHEELRAAHDIKPTLATRASTNCPVYPRERGGACTWLRRSAADSRYRDGTLLTSSYAPTVTKRPVCGWPRQASRCTVSPLQGKKKRKLFSLSEQPCQRICWRLSRSMSSFSSPRTRSLPKGKSRTRSCLPQTRSPTGGLPTRSPARSWTQCVFRLGS